MFVSGVPDKKGYRKYSVRTKSAPDDTAMIEEVVSRSLSRTVRENKPLPDLVVVDGGKGQVSAALRAARGAGIDKPAVVGLAKAKELIYLPGRKDPLELPRGSEALKLLQRLRDEAHRFGLAYHRSRRGAARLRTLLDGVPGLGPKRRSVLMRRFGSPRAIAAASEEEISSIPGFGGTIAKRVKEALGGYSFGKGARA